MPRLFGFYFSLKAVIYILEATLEVVAMVITSETYRLTTLK